MSDRSTTIAQSRSKRSGKRAVTSCSECYRRKQKCDRIKPCNFCSARGVPDRCQYRDSSYQSSDRSVQFKQNDSGDSVAVNKGGDKLTESVPPTGLLQQVGYAPSSGSDIIRSLETDDSGGLASLLLDPDVPSYSKLPDSYHALQDAN